MAPSSRLTAVAAVASQSLVADNRVGYLWSASRGTCLGEFQTGEELRTLAFLPQQGDQPLKLLAGSWDGTVSLWFLYAGDGGSGALGSWHIRHAAGNGQTLERVGSP